MEELDEIEKAMYQTSTFLSSQGWNQSASWFEEHWKPKFDKIRSLIVSPELKKAMYDIAFEMMECEPYCMEQKFIKK